MGMKMTMIMMMIRSKMTMMMMMMMMTMMMMRKMRMSKMMMMMMMIVMLEDCLQLQPIRVRSESCIWQILRKISEDQLLQWFTYILSLLDTLARVGDSDNDSEPGWVA